MRLSLEMMSKLAFLWNTCPLQGQPSRDLRVALAGMHSTRLIYNG